MRTPRQYLAVATLASLPWHFAIADQAHREHDAHVHGTARLNIAVEKDHIDAVLDTPAMNVVGFEHAPRDAGQREAVARAAAVLKDGAERLVPSGAAGCALDRASVASSLLEAGHDHEAAHDDHEQDHDGHDESKDGHEHEHEHESHDGDHDEPHAEFQVRYRFHCRAPDAIEAIQVNLFDEFPGMETIELQVLTDTHQIGGVLTPDENRIDLSR